MNPTIAIEQFYLNIGSIKGMVNALTTMHNQYFEDVVNKNGWEVEAAFDYNKIKKEIEDMKGIQKREWYENKYKKIQREFLECEQLREKKKDCFKCLKELDIEIQKMIGKLDIMLKADKTNINDHLLILNIICNEMKNDGLRDEGLARIKVNCNQHKFKKNVMMQQPVAKAVEQSNPIKPTVNQRLSRCDKYVVNNIPILEKWCGLKFKEVLYDSEIDGKSSSIFRNKTMNHSHLYFIVIDSNDNVFGHYHDGIIDKMIEIKDNKIFMFTLNSNGRCGIMKFNNKKPEYVCTRIWNDKYFYGCGYCGYGVCEIDRACGIVNPNISEWFDVNNPTIFTGLGIQDCYIPKRIDVLEFN